MLLAPGEQRIRSAYAVIDGDHRPDGVQAAGVLYLTNHRIAFEAPSTRGVVRDFLHGRDTRLVVDHPLAEILNASVRQGRIGRPWLVVQLRHGHPAFDVLDPESWVHAIGVAKSAFVAPAESPATVVERQVVKVRCRYCGSLAREADGRCPYCGAGL
jgi:hypothetical protein